MRYVEIDDINFTTQEGDVILIKDIRPIPDYSTLSNYTFDAKDDIDEVASRRNHFGDGGEDRSYAIVEANKEKFDESNYIIDNIRGKVAIPIV